MYSWPMMALPRPIFGLLRVACFVHAFVNRLYSRDSFCGCSMLLASSL